MCRLWMQKMYKILFCCVLIHCSPMFFCDVPICTRPIYFYCVLRRHNIREIFFYDIFISFLFFPGNTDLLCQNQVNIVVKPKWAFQFHHLPLRTCLNKIFHNRKINNHPMRSTRRMRLGEAFYAKLKAKSILMNEWTNESKN